MDLSNTVGNFTPNDKYFYVSPSLYSNLTGIRLKIVYELITKHELRVVGAEGKVKIAVHERLFGCACRRTYELDWSVVSGAER